MGTDFFKLEESFEVTEGKFPLYVNIDIIIDGTYLLEEELEEGCMGHLKPGPFLPTFLYPYLNPTINK